MFAAHRITKKTAPDIDDIRGEYIIDRDQFPGKQADWQYNHFRFEITDDDRFIFYETDKEKVIHTYRGHIEYNEIYKTPRIKLLFNKERHHIIADNPTLYRNTWSFYYVFHSEKFGNVFSRKVNGRTWVFSRQLQQAVCQMSEIIVPISTKFKHFSFYPDNKVLSFGKNIISKTD